MKQTQLQLLLWSSRAWCLGYSSFLPTGPVHGNDDGVLPLHIHDPGEYMDPPLIRSGMKNPALMTPAALSFFNGIQ